MDGQLDLNFKGSDYEEKHDQKRLTGQAKEIFLLMKDGKWRTLSEIEQATGHMTSSISAQLRNLRKNDFGMHTIEKRPRGNRDNGLWEYQLIVNEYGDIFN